MNEEWVWLWFRCLKLNKPYKEYCELILNTDFETCKKLEEQYIRIAEIYDDFGDIYAFNEREQNRKHWFEWLKDHQSLFTTTTETHDRRTITTSPKYELNFKQRAGKTQLQTVRRCLAVWHRLEPLPGRGKPTVPQLTRLFAGHELGNPAVWDDWSTAKMDRRGTQEDNERQIQRYRQKGQKMINRTIDGLFPAYR